MKQVAELASNTFRGLVQRRLWPVAGLLLAALVAIPVLLTAEPAPQPAPAGAVAGATADAVPAPIVQVASAAEREQIRRVLGSRKDPFRPRSRPKADTDATASGRRPRDGGRAEATPARTPAPTGGGGGAAVTAPVPAPATVAPTPTPTSPKTVYETYSLTVRFGSSDEETLERRNLERLGALPSLDDPVLIYLGLVNRGRTAVFLLDAGVTTEGDGRCRPDPASCQTVELEAGETQFFEVEGPDGSVRQFQLDLVRIHRERTTDARAARLARASEADGGRDALRTLTIEDDIAYEYDRKTGLLGRVRDDS